jgi:hypothetical protein
MSRFRRSLMLGIGMLLPLGPRAYSQTVKPEPEKFRYERTIIPGGEGPNRLSIDATLLSGGDSGWRFQQEEAGSQREPLILATGGLADFRIYDASGTEIPYLFILPPKPGAEWQESRISPLAPTEKQSGLQIDLGKPLLVDRLVLNGIPAPFVKRCVLEASNDERYWVRLGTDITLFDLPDEGLRKLEIEFPQQEYRYFRIVWDDRASDRVPLPRSAFARLVSAGSLAPRLEEPLPFERRESEPGTSRYRIRLPGPGLPMNEVRLSAGGGNILRRARITEGRLEGGDMRPIVTGTAMLRREVQGDLSAAQLSIRIQPPREAVIDLVIEDGDNPPLEITGISGVFAYLPWIYFESPGPSPLVARYGYPELEAPRYDLEAARLTASRAKTVEAGWGEVRTLVPEKESFADDSIPSEGAGIDLSLFSYSRGIGPGKTGLNVLPMDAAVLAHSLIRDLRIATGNGNQIPYILERLDEPLSIELPPLEKAELPSSEARGDLSRTGGRSVYMLRLPYPDLPEARLVFSTSSRVFRRDLSVRIEKSAYDDRQDPWTHIVGQETWGHADPEVESPPLSLRIPLLQTTELMVVVEEGDNLPLPITSVRLLLPSYQLRFYRSSDAALRLYYGNKELPAPRYDLEILAPRLTGVAAEEVSMEGETSGSVREERSATPVFFWVILIAAVGVLLGLIARLAKKC